MREVEIMRKFLMGKTAFSVVERGWYHGPDNIAIFPTEEEALKFLGITKEENEAEKLIKHTGEYCYRVVEEIDLVTCFDNIIKAERENEYFTKVSEVENKGNQRIYNEGYCKGREETKAEIAKVIKKFIHDLPGWTSDYLG